VAKLFPPGDGCIAVRSDCEGVELLRDCKSAVALTADRDQFGLWELTTIPNKMGPPVRVRWRWIPPGTFWMGSPEHEQGRWDVEGPRHLVTLTKGYWMAETACTQELWRAVMGENPSYFQNDQHPVETVSWQKVQEFLMQLRQIAPDLGVDLPTEAQWEYACRAGSETAVYPTRVRSGRVDMLGEHFAVSLEPIAWYCGNNCVLNDHQSFWSSALIDSKQIQSTTSSTQPVKMKLPNPWGLYDMLGNVLEWCLDEWHLYSDQPEIDPLRFGNLSSGIVSRVCRGGCWLSYASYVRCASRARRLAHTRDVSIGFRLVRVPTP
jgi:formylglycine-generating enzyme required for sulfatase activity